jgi:predicted nuclease of restriction endonuclease-like (RecB) superfamily
MASKKIIGQEYSQWLAELKEKIRNSQLRAALKVNAEMLQLYWELGKAISEKIQQADWGDKIIPQLAADLRSEFKETEGFSATNLKYMRRWYQFYAPAGQHAVDQLKNTVTEFGQHSVDQIVQQHVGQFPMMLGLVPWGHHIQVMTRSQTIEEALFYVQQTALHNWKRTVLIHQVDSALYHRKGKAQNNFEITLPQPQSELAVELLKNPYNIGFLNLSEEVSERDLENAILANIKKFLLELGVGFSFYGQQFHLKVGDKDFYIDLIFYHTRLHCYFVIELKVTEFEPEHAGKLEFYITAVDEQIKLQEDNPTIGLLLCKTADKVIVEYSLKTKSKPMGVAEYKHAIPKKWKNELPDEKLLKQELEKEIIIPQKPVDEKIDRLKEIVKKMNVDPADLEKDDDLIKKVFTEIQQPLIKLIDKKLVDVKSMFKSYKVEGRYNQKTLEWNMRDFDIDARLLLEENVWMLGFEFMLETFIMGGTNAFNVWQRLEIHLDKHKYIIGPDRGKVWIEKVYRKFLTENELEDIADRFVETIIDDINDRAEKILEQ